MVLCQGAYCRRILKWFGMELAACSLTPTVTSIDDLLKTTHINETEIEGMGDFLCRALVGSFLYLSCHTRPDVAFAVGVFARFVENPSCHHWKAGKRIL